MWKPFVSTYVLLCCVPLVAQRSFFAATGLGFCFSFQPAVTILGHYFVRRRTFANAMSSTGTALGLCTLPLLGNYLHTELGWRGSFLVLGALLLNCCVCGALMRPLAPRTGHRGQLLAGCQRPEPPPPPPPQDNRGPRQGKSGARALCSSLWASLRKHMAIDLFRTNLHYRLYAIGITWTMLGFVVPLVYLVPYATSNGMGQGKAALLLSILGIVNIVVRPPIGLLFNLPWFKGRHIYIFSAALLLNGLSNSICCVGPSFPVLLVYVVAYGLSMSVVGSLMFTVLMQTVEMSAFPAALGLLAVMESVTLLIGPPLAGMPTQNGPILHSPFRDGNVAAFFPLALCVKGTKWGGEVVTKCGVLMTYYTCEFLKCNTAYSTRTQSLNTWEFLKGPAHSSTRHAR